MLVFSWTYWIRFKCRGTSHFDRSQYISTSVYQCIQDCSVYSDHSSKLLWYRVFVWINALNIWMPERSWLTSQIICVIFKHKVHENLQYDRWVPPLEAQKYLALSTFFDKLKYFSLKISGYILNTNSAQIHLYLIPALFLSLNVVEFNRILWMTFVLSAISFDATMFGNEKEHKSAVQS